MKFALLSVSDKTGITKFASKLHDLGFTLLSTGGTAKALRAADIPVTEVSEFTGSPEIFDGRVKTLHPKVHGGILNIRKNPAHKKEADANNIENIDLVAVNLYPFEETVLNGAGYETVIENIDIGGPSMVRSAAKNHEYVTVVVSPNDYSAVATELQEHGETSLDTRKRLAAKAFSHTALYDTLIAGFLNRSLDIKYPEEITFGGRLLYPLRYGENPHQSAAFYRAPLSETGVAGAEKLHGKELSYNNIGDIDAAVGLLRELTLAACVIVKHMNPCGVAEAEGIEEAYDLALSCDPVSAFGGIVAVNREVTPPLAEKFAALFLEVIIAPSFTDDAFAKLAEKKNIRLIRLPGDSKDAVSPDFKKVSGGFLAQEHDSHTFKSLKKLKCPTKRQPTEEELKSLAFAWAVAKYVKSNAIVYAVGTRTIGIGAGQMSRVDSSKIAAFKANFPLEGAVMASDAFFPFRDSVDEAVLRGITAIISPGGSIKDAEVIQAADEAGIAMVFTGVRHFRH